MPTRGTGRAEPGPETPPTLVLAMTTLLQLLPASLVLLPVASNTADTHVAFSPEKGTRWTKTFSHESSMSGGDLSVVMDGQAVPEEFLPVI